MFVEARASLSRATVRLRMWWWRGDHVFAPFLMPRHLALPAVPGWVERVQTVARDGVYMDPVRKIIGAPPEWTLIEQDAEGRWVSVSETCAATGVPISGHPFTGARCARCGVPLSVQAAGMRESLDIPSCRPCRSYIRAAKRDA